MYSGTLPGPGNLTLRTRLFVKDATGKEITSCVFGVDCYIVDGTKHLPILELYVGNLIKTSGDYRCEAVPDETVPAMEITTYVEVDSPPAAYVSYIRGSDFPIVCKEGNSAMSSKYIKDQEGHQLYHCKGEDCNTKDRDGGTVEVHGHGIKNPGSYWCETVDESLESSSSIQHTIVSVIDPSVLDSRKTTSDGPTVTPTITATSTQLAHYTTDKTLPSPSPTPGNKLVLVVLVVVGIVVVAGGLGLAIAKFYRHRQATTTDTIC